MRFTYSFQKIVDLKQGEKRQAEWVLSLAVGRLTREESSLADLMSEKQAMEQRLSEAAAGRATISELALIRDYIDHLDRAIDLKHRDVDQAKRQVAAQKEQLKEKMVQEKVWMKAREKAYRKFVAEALRKEQEELDEMAVMRHSRLI
jgi:flagellar FliJ protein